MRKTLTIISDIIIVIGLAVATTILSRFLIPYVSHVSNVSTKIDSSADIFSYMASGASWFSTSLQGYKLPAHRWYIVLAISAIVQSIVGELESCLGYQSLDTGDTKKNFIRNEALSVLVVSPLTTAFMLQLTIFFILTICPQNIPLLFILGELVIFALPSLIHKYLIRRDFSISSMVASVVRIILLFFMAKTESKALAFFLFAFAIVKDFMDSRSGGEEDKKKFFIPGVVPFALYSLWVIAGISYIRPIVSTHTPTIERTVEKYYVKNIAVGADSIRFIRTDGNAITTSNTVQCENVKQIATCKANDFYLNVEGELLVTNSTGNIPTKIMDNVAYIANYRETLIVIDENGDLYGFGDFTYYLPDATVFDEITLMESGHHFVKGDVGQEHILLIDEDGNLYSLGRNSVGELGVGSKSMDAQGIQFVMADVKETVAGIGTSYALTNDGQVYAWGRNEYGQLGIHYTKVQLGYSVDRQWLYAEAPQPLELDAVITEIAVGVQSAFALDDNGQIWAWGHGISKYSVSKPTVAERDVKHIYSCKFNDGKGSQRLYMINTSDSPAKQTYSQYSSFDIARAEIIEDTTQWMPEPIQKVSSKLEDYLDRFYVDESEKEEVKEPEATPEPIQVMLNPVNTKKSNAYWYQEYNGHKYRIFDEFIGMDYAETYCESMGGHLATITSQEELDFILRMIRESDVSSNLHIGLNYNGKYSWVTKEDTSFIDEVHDNQAYKGDNGAGVLRPNGKMNVGTPDLRVFICEWE